MKAVRKFIAWQPVLTDHQAFTLEALAAEARSQALAYVTSMEDSIRKDQGWSDTQVRSIERRLIPERGFYIYCLRQLRLHRSEVHLFFSPFQQPRLMLCILLAAFLRMEFYLVSEPYSPEPDGYLRDNARFSGKLKSALRPVMYRAYVMVLCSRLSGIFAISRLAVEQYYKAGMPKNKLFPFGYFIPVDKPLVEEKLKIVSMTEKSIRIIFIGSLIRRKGFDLLLTAVSRLLERGVRLQLDLYGPGSTLGIPGNQEQICYKGVIPFGQAQQVVAGYDLLVLPSRYDGWGVVVNEALCAGVPVVCSDRAGAGVMAARLGAGLTFPSGNAEALELLIEQLASQPAKLAALRHACREAANAIQPIVAAHYMFNVIQADVSNKAEIRAPWDT